LWTLCIIACVHHVFVSLLAFLSTQFPLLDA
jgi:hypothetical protein